MGNCERRGIPQRQGAQPTPRLQEGPSAGGAAGEQAKAFKAPTEGKRVQPSSLFVHVFNPNGEAFWGQAASPLREPQSPASPSHSPSPTVGHQGPHN